jgi:hypothetical protein
VNYTGQKELYSGACGLQGAAEDTSGILESFELF